MLDFNKKIYLNDGISAITNEPIQIQVTDQPIYLEHDNVNTSTISIYTGLNSSGTRINDFTYYQDSTRNWMYYIRFGSTARSTYGGQNVYVNYTSYGDQIDDLMINRLEQEWERHETEDPHADESLKVVTTTPGANASGVSTSVVIKFVSNKWLDTNQESKFKLYSDSNRTVEVSSTVTKTGAKEYSLTPSSPLLNSTMYYPRILQGLLAADGTDLKQSYDWSFQIVNIL